MTVKKMGCCFIAVIVLPLFLVGCQNSRDLRELEIVAAIGIDSSKEEGKAVSVTAEIVLPAQLKGGTQGGSSSGPEKPYYNLISDGDTVLTTLREMTRYTSNKLYLSHNQVIIFGRSIAENGIRPHLSFFIKDNETRPLTQIFVAETTASDTLNAGDMCELMPAICIKKLIENQEQTSFSAPTTLHDITNSLLSDTASFVVPIVRVEEVNGEKQHKIEGLAVFKADKMIGELNERESRGLLFGRNKVSFGMTPVFYKDQNVTLEIISSKSKIHPQIEGQDITFNISVKINSTLMEQSGTKPMNTGKDLDELEALQREVVKEEINMAFEKAKSLNADIFGFGLLLQKYHPDEWKTLKEQWDEAFQSVKINVSVKNQIRNTGLSSNPLAPEEENGQE